MGHIDVETRPATYRDWHDICDLFGEPGASDGCWCVSLRDDAYEKLNCSGRKDVLRSLLLAGDCKAILAYSDDTPVGWCSFGKCSEFPEISRRFSAPFDDWMFGCFFVREEFRGLGVQYSLARSAVAEMLSADARRVFAYVACESCDTELRRDWAFTGSLRLFLSLGFSVTGASVFPLSELQLCLV